MSWVAVSRRLVLGIALWAGLAGCAPEVVQMPGVRTAGRETASLVVLTNRDHVLALDDTEFEPPLVCGDQGAEYPIPAGEHTVTFRTIWLGWTSGDGQAAPAATVTVLAFVAKPGHRYRLQLRVTHVGLGGMTASSVPILLDLETDEIVSTLVESRDGSRY